MQLDAEFRIGIKGKQLTAKSHTKNPQGPMPCGFTPVDLLFLDLPPRPTHQFALAVRTNVLHFLRTMCAKGAFVRTNVSFAIH
jgi:hypothetical protein